MSTPLALETGRYNVISSFNAWARANVDPGSPPAGIDQNGNPFTIPFTVRFDRPIEVAALQTGPVICFVDLGLFSPAALDVNDRLRWDPVSGTQHLGKKQQTLIEILIWGSQRIRKDEETRIRRLRDLVEAAFLNAGRRDPVTAAYIVPPIRILDYATNMQTPADTGKFVEKDRAAAWLTESRLDDPAHPDLIAWRGVLRLWWLEFYTA